ncbi:sugar transferase [Microbispora cellulosiformans]|uniref:Sugar transferase n=1 Tax=Microbispora cellulosiformans TaxID=2614688 RepID=A0A5J5JZ34_9ACTN|nr:sugar transferase [Microbispora cellulosiformans]KAA9376436.1 sugar transferase [Microbispora cellulosiformans]
MDIAIDDALYAVRQSTDRAGWPRRHVRVMLVGDVACGALSVLGVLGVRLLLGEAGTWESALAASLVVAWPLVVALIGGYDTRHLGDGAEEYRKVLHATAALASVVAISAYLTQTLLARSYVMVAIPLAGLCCLLLRYGLRKRLHRRRRAGECLRRVVVVGHWGSVLELHAQLSRQRHHGMRIVAACVPPEQHMDLPAQFDGFPVLGDFSDVAEVVERVGADTVAVLSCPELDGSMLRRLTWQLEETGTELYVASALMEVAGPRISIRPVAGLPLLHVAHPDLRGGKQLVKSVFDRVVAALILIVILPVLLTIGLVIRVTSGGPVLFRQPRVGKDGRLFVLYKFRTMVRNAEAVKHELTQRDAGNGVLFKMRKDPRVTPVGGVLRRYSLDELTQLLNVLRGEMSLVGPRPPLPEEVAQYGDDVRRRLLVKPGMTGLWQVSGRSELSWEESVRLDLRYVENWSLIMDLQILWKTWAAVVGGEGAY